MKLFYLTNSNLKSMPANAVQTKHMFDAFSNIGCSVKYFVRKSNSNYHNGLIWPSGLILLHILIFKIFNYKKKSSFTQEIEISLPLFYTPWL